jgi:hypothetical protein
MDLNPNFTNLKTKQDISFLSRSGYQVMAIRFEKTKFKVWGNRYLKPYSLCSQPLSKSIRSSNLSLGCHLFFFLLIIISCFLFTLCCVHVLLFHFGLSRIWGLLVCQWPIPQFSCHTTDFWKILTSLCHILAGWEEAVYIYIYISLDPSSP